MMLRMTVALCSNIAVDSVAALWYVVVLRTPCTQLRLRDLSAFYFGVRRCHAARRLQYMYMYIDEALALPFDSSLGVRLV